MRLVVDATGPKQHNQPSMRRRANIRATEADSATIQMECHDQDEKRRPGDVILVDGPLVGTF